MARAMTGADILLQALADHGVEHIFGYPGGAVLPIYDEMSSRAAIKPLLSGTSRARSMQPRDMHALAARWVSCSSPPVQVPLTL